MPGFESATIVFVPESNLAFEGYHQANRLRKTGVSNLCIMEEDDNRPGIRTDHKLKKAMSTALRDKIVKGHLRFHRSFVVTHADCSQAKVLKQMYDELDGFSIILKPSKTDPHAEPKELYTGKQGHGTDDLAIALQLNLVAMRRFKNSDKYADWK